MTLHLALLVRRRGARLVLSEMEKSGSLGLPGRTSEPMIAEQLSEEELARLEEK